MKLAYFENHLKNTKNGEPHEIPQDDDNLAEEDNEVGTDQERHSAPCSSSTQGFQKNSQN